MSSRTSEEPTGMRASAIGQCLWMIVTAFAAGCGTTRMTDTQRTATEQLLISNSVDQAVSLLDFRVLCGKTVFFDPQYLDGCVDRGYLVSSVRQQLLACGCILQEERAKACYVVEARAGGVGTDRHALLVGVPQMSIPAIVPGQPSQIPEIPFAKKTDQNGVAKIAVFAYNRQTGKPIWQSGVVQAVSTSHDVWVLGAGPFQRGTIRAGTEFAGQPLPALPLGEGNELDEKLPPPVEVTHAASWPEPGPAKLSPLAGAMSLALWSSPGAAAAIAAAQLLETQTTTTAAAERNFLERWLLGDKPAAPAAATAPAPKPPATANAGGQAETAPSRLLISGLRVLPDG